MDLDDARTLAERLVAHHGLRGWRVAFDTAKRRAGVCRYDSRTISLSAPITRLHSAAEVRDTILHEIAHALVGPAEGHSARWRAAAVRIGGSGERTVPVDAPQVPGAWVGVCSAGHRVERHRRPQRVASCRDCAQGFRLEHVFEWTHRTGSAELSPAYVTELAALRAGHRAGHRGGLLPPGSSGRIVLPGKYEGMVGRVQKVGRTRYQLRTARGLVTVSFAGVEPVAR